MSPSNDSSGKRETPGDENVLLALFLQKPDPAPMSGTDLRALDSAAVLQRQMAPWTTLSATTGPPPVLITSLGLLCPDHIGRTSCVLVSQRGRADRELGGRKIPGTIRTMRKASRGDTLPRIPKNLDVNLYA